MSIVDDAIAQDVRTYAAQVRAALADLGPEHVDDLTDGLEANLADALADDGRAHRGSLVDEFGAPGAYAAELRTAAGLAPALGGARPESRFRAALLAPWRAARDAERTTLARLRATRWFPHVEELLVELRPAWWVLRGWTLAHLLLQVVGGETYAFWLPSTSGGWVLLLLAVVASAQWGRGRWRTGPRWHRVLRVVNGALAFAAVVLLLTLPQVHRSDAAAAQTWVETTPQDGVLVAGEYASNLFVYDAEGNPVDGAQVFDQDGRPVTTEPYAGDIWMQQEFWPDGADAPLIHVGVPGVNGQSRWNVFPLHTLPRDLWEDAETAPDPAEPDVRRQLVTATWPFAAAAPVTPWTTETVAPTPRPSPGTPEEPATEAPAAGAADSGLPGASDAPATDAPVPAP
ncbi:conserved hypothetical protein [Cellulomonas flavigena DSM 20109]|uniref:Uncharacterized protein n=1 Tax=Cellulomonas flavigena (strain ATCC 482 / DSM 20109 / BCRC 11376 / JCM 18109 / NBRC 3775 / NCIMB 8073 / NRS 134) TaxID=446466 RepID=D5UKK5_CELFN|nr:hypothetical protein [Cellulomonas flavigena]ADG73823.1 conserved hypothetical protein [Cellulomonas flavigena DSM 20109]